MTRHILVCVYDQDEIEITGHDSAEDARNTLVAIVHGMCSDDDALPQDDTDEKLIGWLNHHEISFVWKIQEIPA